MCLQDFQMARRTQARGTVVTGTGAVLAANPLRLRIIVAANDCVIGLRFGGDQTTGSQPHTLTGYADTGGTVLYSRTGVFRVEDLGALLLGDVTVVTFSGNGSGYVTDVFALPDLDRIITNGK